MSRTEYTSSPVQEDLKQAVAVLKKGGLILYPTDTVWGIGCDATNSAAVRQVYALKGRDDHKALITLVGDIGMLERVVNDVPDVAYNLIEYSERPLTIVYDKGVNVAPELMGDDGTLGVRVTREEFSSRLCRMLGRPLVSTSANISGEPSPRVFSEISDEIRGGVDYICASRRDENVPSLPSTVMRLCGNGEFKVLRP